MPDTEAPTPPAFRAAVRSKSTRWSVVYGERIARGIITVGGLMVIVAVLGIMVFLFRVVAPLLAAGEVREELHYSLPGAKQIAWLNADEFQTLASVLGTDGAVTTFHVPTGREILRDSLDFGGVEATAVGGVLVRDGIGLGFADGTVRFATLGFAISTTARGRAPETMERIDGRDLLSGTSVLTQVQTGDFRTITPVSEIGEPVAVSESPIIALDYSIGGTVERPVIAFATVDADNIARVSQSRVQRNLMTGEETVTTTSAELPGLDLADGVSVTAILLARGGDRVFVATDEGIVYRYDARDMNAPVLAERRRVLPDGVAVTALELLGGDQAMVVGGADGSVEVFFRLQRAAAPTADGYELVHARTHEPQASAVIGIAPAQRDKSFATLGADGSVLVRHSTSDQMMFAFERQGDASAAAEMMIFPRSNGVLLVDAQGAVDVFSYDVPHPEITLRVLFGKIWYEGYNEPGFTWQSTAGTDLAEPKYSLVPLIFGTLKAAFYAMLFATPIAIMAAIYTSEFVHTSVRATVKPVMEMMESLPTVVLGFLAALVIAPLVEEWIAAVLLGFIAVPMGLMLGAFVWQMLPVQVALRYNGLPKFTLMGVMIVLACLVAYGVGPLFELALFDGDFKAWTAGAGDGTPFMFLLQLPLAYLVVSWGFHRIYGHFLRDRMRSMDRAAAGRLDFLRWIAFFFAAMALSYAVAIALTAIGFDPRGNVVDSYQQRNALVVGFAMAFAVIPSIYTLCEDALNAVPSHLRAGSLAAGATPWQTAKWIVLPTAASGVFSAVMMGMGRAVGETMIVVMAAGNTPIMEWNIFSGLRTLSANIAIELPEAVKDGTNYRVLFLAALTLFLMTFFINTIAELIRQRFRKRAFNL